MNTSSQSVLSNLIEIDENLRNEKQYDFLCRKCSMVLNLQFFADGPGGEKTEEPTAKKLEDARKEGQVAKSKDIAPSITLLALFIILKVWSGRLGIQFMESFNLIYGKFSDYTTLYGGQLTSRDFTDLVGQCLMRVIVYMLPFLLASFIIAFVANIVQVKWKPTAKPLQPKFSKLNPIQGIKKMFNIQSLMELLKSLVKIAVVSIIIYNDLKKNIGMLYLFYDMPLLQAIAATGNFLIDVGIKISAFFIAIAFVDFIFQKWKFRRDMRMTKQEVKEEYKNTEGDPQIKGKQRRRMQEASMRRMMQNLPKADVVITNPTHYAVAIVYDKDMADAPIVLAKGADYLAQRIKEIARDNKISIVENKPLARSLYANVEVGDQVPQELYVAVAEVLAAVYKATGRA